jgi:hypothetical protein
MLSDLGVAPGVASNIQHQVKAGVAINKGQAVYVTGADGTNMIVGLASNASEATSSKTMGLMASTVATNGFGNVIAEGLLAGLDTSTANAGDPVWLGTGGNLIYGLINKPYAPNHLVFIGIVTRANANNGEIFVKVQNGFELNEIHDADLKTNIPVNGDILGFNGTLWVNKTIAAWLGYTPVSQARTLTINGTSYDLSADRSWSIAAGVTSFNTRTGAITLTSGDVTGALGYTPYNSSNPNGYISSYTETDPTVPAHVKSITTTEKSNWNTAFSWGNHASAGYLTSVTNISGYARSLNGFANQTEYTILDGPANGPVWKVRYDSATANRYVDLGFKDGNGVYSTGLKIYNGDTPTWQGSTLLHAGNYSSYAVPTSRTITINGTSYDLSANRSWTITASETDTLATVVARGNTANSSIAVRNSISINKSDGSSGGQLSYDSAINQLYLWNSLSSGYFSVYTNNSERLNIASGGAVTANVDMRAPIFYDSLNTYYYLDPGANSRLYSLLVHRGTGGGGQNIFAGLEGAETANGRGQIVISSSYSDMVIASSQDNDQHGSTLSFTAFNPANRDQYRKFVVNQGNWGTRKHMLSFGYSDAPQANPHNAINSGVNTLTLDGLNRRVGIKVEDPGYALEVNGDAYSTSSRADTFYKNTDTTYWWQPGNDTSHRFQTPNGYIDIGPKNSSHAHIYTDRNSFYFNKEALINGGTVWHSFNDGAGSGLDADLIDGIGSHRIVYGTGASKIGSHSNANEWRDSGFYENEGGGSNWPGNTWYNSINVRHSNQGNYHGFQLAMSYYDNNLWFRSYQGAGTFQGWQRAAVARGEGTNYIDYSRYVYNNGAYSGSGWVEPSDLGVRYAASSNYANSSGSSGNAGHLSTAYIGGQRLNPQDYFNNGIGLKAAMTAKVGVWSDTLWINGYSGGDVLWMCALHTQRNSSPRMYISAQQSTSTSYGTAYEFLTEYNYSDYAVTKSTDQDITGIKYFLTNNNAYSGSTSSAKLQAYSTGNNSAFFSFHKAGHYALNMGLDADNVLRIGGWSAAANRWQLDMSGNMTVAGDVTAYSDIRVKENIHTINNALNKVLALRGVTYNRIDSEDKAEKIGVIAQEVQNIIPQVVHEQADGMLGVSYGNITAVLIEAIKEQQTQIEELKKLVKQLTNK